MTTREKNIARAKLSKAVRYGKIIRPSVCQDCGASGQIDGHHFDYAKPLEVEWLCGDCHRSRHIGEPRNSVAGPGRPPTPPRPAHETAALAAVEQTYREARTIAQATLEIRNAAIRQALADGWTLAQIAQETGLSRGRIDQIKHSDPARSRIDQIKNSKGK